MGRIVIGLAAFRLPRFDGLLAPPDPGERFGGIADGTNLILIKNSWIRGVGCGAMQARKAFRVLLRLVLIENDFRPHALKGWLQFCGAEPDHRFLPAPPNHITVFDGSITLKTREKSQSALARNEAIKGEPGKYIEPRRSDLRDKLIVAAVAVSS